MIKRLKRKYFYYKWWRDATLAYLPDAEQNYYFMVDKKNLQLIKADKKLSKLICICSNDRKESYFGEYSKPFIYEFYDENYSDIKETAEKYWGLELSRIED